MAIVPVAGPKRACGNRSRLVDFSPAIDRFTPGAFTGTYPVELPKTGTLGSQGHARNSVSYSYIL
jgi:hypothetical protein